MGVRWLTLTLCRSRTSYLIVMGARPFAVKSLKCSRGLNLPLWIGYPSTSMDLGDEVIEVYPVVRIDRVHLAVGEKAVVDKGDVTCKSWLAEHTLKRIKQVLTVSAFDNFGDASSMEYMESCVLYISEHQGKLYDPTCICRPTRLKTANS